MLRRKKRAKRPKARRKKNWRFIKVTVVIIIVFIIIFTAIELTLKPTIIAFSEAEAKWRATEAINQAVLDTVVAEMDYDKLVHIERNEQNQILYMQQNLLQLNKINAKATLAIQKSLEELKNRNFSIPLGQITGSKLIANYGPEIGLWLLPIGTVSVKVQDHFEDSGINQTRHKIYLNIESDIRVIIPLIASNVSVATQVPIADTVIVGEVPETYMKINLDSEGALFGFPK